MELQIFNNEVFGQVRVCTVSGEPWFVAADVCKALEIVNPRHAVTRLGDDEKNTVVLNDGNRGNPNKTIINEAGLYVLILSSRKKDAQTFKHWVTHEVLPTIRKTGGYVSNADMFVEEYFADADPAMKLMLVTSLTDAKRYRTQLETQRPLVEFAETVQKSDDNILVGALAKLMCDGGTKIGAKRLLKLLREAKVLMKNNVPYQAFIDNGYFHVKEGYHQMRSGEVKLNFTTLVTPRGQVWAVRKVRKILDARVL